MVIKLIYLLFVETQAWSIHQGILTYNRYTQREFKLKFSACLKARDGKYTENSYK